MTTAPAHEPDHYVDLIANGESYRFRLSGGPLSHPDVNPAVLEAYGFAAGCWARIERHIDMIVNRIKQFAASGHTIVPVPVKSDEFAAHCRTNNIGYNPHNLDHFIFEKAARKKE